MRGAYPTSRKLVIADPGTCIGCKTCMAACLMRHDVPNDVPVPRLTLVTTRTISAPVGCHHCAEAPCADACPTGCLYTDDEHVGVHPDKCIGCRNCVLACPYGAVDIVTRPAPPEPGEDCHPGGAQASTCHPERSAQRGVEGSPAAPAGSATADAARDPSTTALRASAQDDKLAASTSAEGAKPAASTSAGDGKTVAASASVGALSRAPVPAQPEKAASEPSAKPAAAKPSARDRAKAKKRRRKLSTVVKCDLCVDHADGPACVAACPTKALRLIDPQMLERGKQAKRKAAARAAAAYSTIELNADLDEGE
ncbi:4Fe-4S dicluster domain-containing protein [Gordonibacter massiliensis (ex Traore et al. 2017)]|uniref:4Fe-4S dicluster domain-containing protein n=1 Tax=Gordonibacter massiliensis (ex Traore et al. 2017) TaxID=1841863 RepID=UPI00349FE101